MTSRPSTSRGTIPGSSYARSSQSRIDRPPTSRNADLDRSVPPMPALSLPDAYEIPSLRQRSPQTVNDVTPTKHNRSASHPFPSLFGSRRSDKKQPDDDFDSSDGSTPAKAGVIRAKSGRANKPSNGVSADRQPLTGKCMTCDSTVRWPQEVMVFRCTTCLTINDLEPYEEPRPAKSVTYAPPRRPVSISVERTKKIIDRCLADYFNQVLSSELKLTEPANEQAFSANSYPTDVEVQRAVTEGCITSDLRRTLTPTTNDNSNALPHLPANSASQQRSQSSRERPHTGHLKATSPPGLDANVEDPSLVIFRTLENYIAGCLTGCTALNISFFSIQPNATTSERSGTEPTTVRKNSEPYTTPQLELGDFISELDAKTLLLGDVVENGSWWTGSRTLRQNTLDQTREKSPERWRGIVNAKSPRINWLELAEWYHLIVQAGNDWQVRWNNTQPNPGALHDRWKDISLGRLQHEIGESQLHLQRSLLKSTENLLKRPRRPIKSPEDCRFLLMLLVNPLLYAPTHSISVPMQPGSTNPSSSSRGVNSSSTRELPPKHTSTTSRKVGGLGHHSGIIKRILGLMANLPNDIHNFLVSWLSRFSDSHFQRLVDTVSSFVTYRLCRQQDRIVTERINPTAGLVPTFSDSGIRHASELHAALGIRPSNSSAQKQDGKPKLGIYSEDWQIKAAARVMSLLFQANSGHVSRKRALLVPREERLQSAGLNAKYQAYSHGQIVPISTFYNTMLDHADLVADFEAWETTKTKFTFCQYPFFLSIWAKIHILEHDARRQMEVKAREAFFDSILSRRAVSQYFCLKVRRDCLVEDSLRSVSEVIGSGGDELKKGLRIDFVGEEGIDAGGLRKEWFLSLVREIFDPHHGLFVYDEDSQYCYFNPYCFESSEQFFLVGVLLGLAIYNSTILDIAFPPFVFKKLLASAPTNSDKLSSMPKVTANYTLEDLAEFRPALAKGLHQLLEYDGNVQDTFCRDFVIEVEKYGQNVQIPLCNNGQKRAVTNSNRREFVDLYVRYVLDVAVVRQYEPFKRGFYTVCGGNALSLFRPEEIELLVRGSDEPLDVLSLRAVASYENWPKSAGRADDQAQVIWFWDCFESATPSDQRKLLGFITGSDRIPAMGATNLNIKLQLLRDSEAEEFGTATERFPIARTCFNTLGLYSYESKAMLENKLWRAVYESEGFGLK